MEPPGSAEVSPYRDQEIAVGTRHGKQHQFAVAFHQQLHASLVTPPDLDTDQFGTFTGEVQRTDCAVTAARAKSRLAMNVTGLPFGLASEASYGLLAGGWPGPLPGLPVPRLRSGRRRDRTAVHSLRNSDSVGPQRDSRLRSVPASGKPTGTRRRRSRALP